MEKHQCIMVVDDEQAILSLLIRTLEPEGYGVIVADNGESALALLDEHKPDLVILDVMMPGLDGFQVLDMIRQRYSIPVIMLIGKDEVACLHNNLAAGADDYVTKPLSMPELMARIGVKLRQSGVKSRESRVKSQESTAPPRLLRDFVPRNDRGGLKLKTKM